MLYLRQDFNIHPAAPATRDRFVETATETLIPCCERLGARLLAAWFNNAEWFSQITHVLEFDDLSSLERFRDDASRDAAWAQVQGDISAIAPERREELLEPLGPVAEEAIHEAMEKSRDDPAEV